MRGNGRINLLEVIGKVSQLPIEGNVYRTKTHIIYEATLLFAKNGYAAVSVRDIVENVGITPGALYNHFPSKEALWLQILSLSEEIYKLFFSDLEKKIGKAEDLNEALELFFEEPLKEKNSFACYAISMVMNEKIHDKNAARVYSDTFFRVGTTKLRENFDRFIRDGKIGEFDTENASLIVLSLLLRSIDNIVQQTMGMDTPFENEALLSAAKCCAIRHMMKGE